MSEPKPPSEEQIARATCAVVALSDQPGMGFIAELLDTQKAWGMHLEAAFTKWMLAFAEAAGFQDQTTGEELLARIVRLREDAGEVKRDDDDPEPRAETGVMQFGDDWPGVFVRGDNAFHFAVTLEQVLDQRGSDAIETAVLRGLATLLKSCDVRQKPEPQLLKPFERCTAAAKAPEPGDDR